MQEEKKRIIIADPSSHILEKILAHPSCKNYEVYTADTGPECLNQIHQLNPSLVVMDLMLPHMHAIELLKLLQANPETKKIGVIVTSYHLMIQNYQAAIEHGVDYFLPKPFEIDFLFELISRFFENNLKPDPFYLSSSHNPHENAPQYEPKIHEIQSYIRFWGTRGSNPVAGTEYLHYGGNTCCLEVRDQKNLIIIDAGTGIRQLGEQLAHEGVKTIHLFIGHTHWDHITGFPFFQPIYQKDVEIIIWAPVGFEKSTKELFTNMLAYAYFPVRLDEMHSNIRFKELRDGRPIQIGSILVDTHYTNHPGPTLGFKIKTKDTTFGYVTDNEVLLGYQGNPTEITHDDPLLEPHLSAIEFFKDCNFMIHEAQYFPKEYHEKVGWGHSSLPNASVFLKYLGIQDWIVTHHDPTHTDALMKEKYELHKTIIEETQLDLKLRIAYDGFMLPI